MIRDREVKAKALRYVVAKRWFPQLEVDILFKGGVSQSDKAITDVDILSLIPDEFYAYRTLLIDCKTSKNESPISRALWLKGLIDQLGAEQGMCILRKESIEQDHRYNAAQLHVVLLSEREFERYSEASGVLSFQKVGHVADIDIWQKYFDLGSIQPALKRGISFCRTQFWMSESESEACRSSIGQLRLLSPELNPQKKEHLTMVADFVSLFMISIARIVHKVFAQYLQPDKKEELSEVLLLLLYGGRDAYDFRNKLLKEYATKHLGLETEPELSPPNWDTFIQLIRQSLDAPFEVSKSPLLMREIGWSFLSTVSDLSFAEKLASESPHAARLAVMGTEYLCKACKLPPEFAGTLLTKLIEVQRPMTSQSGKA